MYFKILEAFLLKTLFSRNEYNITSKDFNPLKIVIVCVLLANVFFSGYLLIKIVRIYKVIQTSCPQILH